MTYESEIEGAHADILEAGETDNIIRVGNSVADPDKPWDVSVAEGKHPCAVLWLSAGKGGGAKKTGGSSILTVTRKLLIAAKGLTITPAANDYIERTNGERWQLSLVDPLDFNGEPILYKVTVTK